MPEPAADSYFRFFNEIGIIEQLSRAMFEARLPAGFIMPHFTVLNHLVRVKDGQTPLALARAFQVPKTSMTHTLTTLEKAKLVDIRPNPDDGRSKCVFITAKGRSFRDKAIEAVAPDLARIAGNVPAENIKAALPVLEALRRYLDQARDFR